MTYRYGDLSPDDEHVTVTGEGGRRRTILLDDRPFIQTTLPVRRQSDITADNELRARQRRPCGRLTNSPGRRPAPERDPAPN